MNILLLSVLRNEQIQYYSHYYFFALLYTDSTDQPELILNMDPFKSQDLKIPYVVNTSVAYGQAAGLAKGYMDYMTGKGYNGLNSETDMQNYVLSIAEESMDQYNR